MKLIRLLRNYLIPLLSFCPNFLQAMGSADPSVPQIPFTFVENTGEVDRRIRYIGMGQNFKAWFEDRKVRLQRGNVGVTLAFEGPAESKSRIRAGDPVKGRANFLQGRSSLGWRTDLALFRAIHYSGLWPGIELIYKGDGTILEAEYLVAPGADPGAIRLRFDGKTAILPDGMLLVSVPGGDFIEEAPVLYQPINGNLVQIPGAYKRLSDGSVGFRVSPYDPAYPLLIDPAILVSGYFGGSGEDNITSVAIDSQNNIVVAGWTSSIGLPASGGEQKKYGGSVDAFVASFSPNGGSLNFCTYLGGAGEDQALGLAVDSSRNIYLTGWTQSYNFPVAGALQTRLKGTRNAFLTKLSAAGNALIYSTYLGGSAADTGFAIAIDPAGGAVIAGDSTSTNLPVTPGVVQLTTGGGQDAFVAYFSPGGNSLKFLTYLGGNGVDHASSVILGGAGHVIVGGYTRSTNFPGVQRSQLPSSGGQYGFVVKLSAPGSSFIYSTCIGGSGGNSGVNGLIVDASGNVTAAGSTSAPDFPVTPGAFETSFAGQTDGFVAHFASKGTLLQATFLGGGLADTITAIAGDFHGNSYVTGATSSIDFPVQWPFQAINAGAMNAFVAKLNSTLSTLIFATYLGGNGRDQANAIAVDAETSIVVAGQTGSQNFAITGVMQNFLPSTLTSFVTKIRPNFTLGVAYSSAGQMEFTADPWHVMTDTASTFYGLSTDIPIVGDWTGTGVKRIGIFRNGTWILDTNGNGVIDAADKTVLFGQSGDIPVVGDWRGTGHIALGLYRNGTFILDYSGHLSGTPTGLSDVTYSNFGIASDIPIASDWSGSGTTKVGVFRNGAWLVDYNGAGVISQTWTYGQAGDIPVVGDWDSSQNPAKIGVYRSGLWVLDYDGDHIWTTPGLTEMSLGFGFAGYKPLVF